MLLELLSDFSISEQLHRIGLPAGLSVGGVCLALLATYFVRRRKRGKAVTEAPPSPEEPSQKAQVETVRVEPGAEGDGILYSFGQITLHRENNGAAVVVHSWAETGEGERPLHHDHTVEFRWNELERAIGSEDAITLNKILMAVGEAAKAKCSKLKLAQLRK